MKQNLELQDHIYLIKNKYYNDIEKNKKHEKSEHFKDTEII